MFYIEKPYERVIKCFIIFEEALRRRTNFKKWPLVRIHQLYPLKVDPSQYCSLSWKLTRPLMICIAIVRSFPICDHPFSLQEQHNDYPEYL